MDGDASAAAMRLVDDGGDLVLGQSLDVAGAAVGQLDEVHAVLTLPADLGDHLRRAVAEDADGMLGGDHPRGLVVLDAPVGDDHAPGAIDPRAFEHAELDLVANADVGEPGTAG